MTAVRRNTAWLALAGYLFSVTAASLYHHHAGYLPDSGEPACACGDHDHLEAGSDEHDRASISEVESGIAFRPASHGHPSDHACPICHFHGQKLTVANRVDAVFWAELRETTVQPKATRPFSEPRSVERVRSPPSWLA